MEPVSPSTPWYQSRVLLILATILLPPVGLILLWMNRDTETGKKVFGSIAILALGAAYLFIFFGSGFFFAGLEPASEAHYAELERQRAAQRETAASVPAAADQQSQSAVTATTANANEPKSEGASAATVR